MGTLYQFQYKCADVFCPEPHALACAVPRTPITQHALFGIIKLELVLQRLSANGRKSVISIIRY